MLTSYSTSVIGGSQPAAESTVEPTSPIPQTPAQNVLPTGGVIVGVG